jgi:hypothetical protein
VSIQTNSADKSKIFLKAGQKVIVLKSPRGICLQLESGKVIAIRASMKPGGAQNSSASGDSGMPNFAGLTSNVTESQADSSRKVLPGGNSTDVIDMTNSDDEEANRKNEEKASLFALNGNNVTSSTAAVNVPIPSNINLQSNPADSLQQHPNNGGTAEEHAFKEKPSYKPNLIARSKKMLPPPSATVTTSSTGMNSSFNSNNSSNYTKMHWNRFDSNSNSTNTNAGSNYPPTTSTTSSSTYRDMNGGNNSNISSSSKSDPYRSCKNI